ncbi:hypothetical protein Taro_051626 [Colocasia esculenta]|uniref:Uncharacterized protein n=1 Tax=Colocasia esculenta TaxID=4460 RepID=A0A843XHB5_COLES|nr:hypothetical protein [Colocasia esculenta]
MSVLEYEVQFVELSKYDPHIVDDESRKVKKFMMGLQPSLRTRLIVLDHQSMEAACAACRQESEMEQYLEEKKASMKRPSSSFQHHDRKKK